MGKNKKRICILSMQNVNNFGSLLQAYSLKKIISNLNAEVYFLNIEANENENNLIYNSLNYSSEIDKYSNSVLVRKFSKLDYYSLNRIKNKLKNKKQNAIFSEFRKERLEIVGNENDKRYDLCVIGSDEVFNCTQNSSWGFTSQLFGNVRQADEVISYAASCGFTKVEQISNSVKKIIFNNLIHMKSISVRDQNTFNFVNDITGIEPNFNLDPVVVADFSKEIEEAEKSYHSPKEKYCLVYAYENRIKDEKEIESIKSFCKSRNLKIIAAGAPQKWIDKFEVVDPFELLVLFKNAEYVITDTFHGTIFSFKFSKRFGTIYRESNINKLSDLMKRLQIENHLIKDLSFLEQVYQVEKNESKVDKLYKLEREKTIKYLEQSI